MPCTPSKAASRAPATVPRVRHVIAQVPAFVDSGDHEIWKAFVDLCDGDVHTVGRRSVDGKHPVVDLLEPQRMTQA